MAAADRTSHRALLAKLMGEEEIPASETLRLHNERPEPNRFVDITSVHSLGASPGDSQNCTIARAGGFQNFRVEQVPDTSSLHASPFIKAWWTEEVNGRTCNFQGIVEPYELAFQIVTLNDKDELAALSELLDEAGDTQLVITHVTSRRKQITDGLMKNQVVGGKTLEAWARAADKLARKDAVKGRQPEDVPPPLGLPSGLTPEDKDQILGTWVKSYQRGRALAPAPTPVEPPCGGGYSGGEKPTLVEPVKSRKPRVTPTGPEKITKARRSEKRRPTHGVRLVK